MKSEVIQLSNYQGLIIVNQVTVIKGD